MLLAAKHLAAQLAQGDIDREEYRERANYDFLADIEMEPRCFSQGGHESTNFGKPYQPGDAE